MNPIDVDYELNLISNLIDNKLTDEACERYINLINGLNTSNDTTDLPKVYKSFAEFLFKCGCYDEGLDMFIDAYNLNYMKVEIESFLYDKFINPNLDYFKDCYNYNIKACNIPNLNIEYSDLTLDFFETTTSEYHIFDKQSNSFKGPVALMKYSSMEYLQKKYADDRFSDIVIYVSWNYEEIRKYLNIYTNRKIYIISDKLSDILSFFKISKELAEEIKNTTFFGSIAEFKLYFESNSSLYLPYNVISANEYKKDELIKVLNEIHNLRLTKEYRDNSNILLSIGIPSYNKGSRVLEELKELTKLKYDSEIEFVISNNGSTKALDEYNKIQNLNDSRVKYYEIESFENSSLNLCNLIDKAKGRFLLLLNEEDIILYKEVDYYLKKIKDNENVAIISTRGSQSMYRTDTYLKAGKQAIYEFMLSNNYFSGTMYNTRIIKKYNLNMWLKQKSLDKTNHAYLLYPHEFLDIAISKYGDVIIDSTILTLERANRLNELTPDDYNNFDSNLNLFKYTLYESRLNELEGWCNLIREIADDDNLIRDMFAKTCNKIFFLVSLVNQNYLAAGYDLKEIYNKIYDKCLEQMEILYENINVTKKINDKKQLGNLRDYYIRNLNPNS